MTFTHLAKHLNELEQTSSRLTMTQLLSDLFSKTSPDEIQSLCYLLQGRVAPLFDAVEFGVADKFLMRAIAQAYEVELADVTKTVKTFGDIGAAAQLFAGEKHSSQMEIVDVYDALKAIAHASGEGSQEQKIGMLSDLFRKLDGLSVRYVARIPVDTLRLGFSEMTILDALSWMTSGDKSLRVRLEEAYNVRPDIGLIAKQVKKDGIEGVAHVKAVVGAPILSALCQRIPTADEMMEKLGEVAVEPKFDGVRVQIHYRNLGKPQMEVSSFSRNLENTTAMFPELQTGAHDIHAYEVILDAEAVGVDSKTGAILPFQETTTRKRKHDIAEAQKNVPLKFFVFDILYKDGEELLSTPLSKRRDILGKMIKKSNIFAISPQIVTKDANVVKEYHDEQLEKGLEGVVVKKWNSPYEPGRKGFSWVKFKEEEGKQGKLTDTIDAVVMGYSLGEGKRVEFGIGKFLVGVRSGESFVTLSKVGTGVTDEQWRELRSLFEKHTSAQKPKEYEHVAKILEPDVWIHPSVVVEIAGDDLTKSPNHGAGYAVRFPRLVRIREDKSPTQATTVSEIKSLYTQQYV